MESPCLLNNLFLVEGGVALWPKALEGKREYLENKGMLYCSSCFQFQIRTAKLHLLKLDLQISESCYIAHTIMMLQINNTTRRSGDAD